MYEIKTHQDYETLEWYSSKYSLWIGLSAMGQNQVWEGCKDGECSGKRLYWNRVSNNDRFVYQDWMKGGISCPRRFTTKNRLCAVFKKGTFFGLEGFWSQPQGPNFPSPQATMLALRLDCSRSALVTPQRVLSFWRLVELKMLDVSDRTKTGISILTSAADDKGAWLTK